MKRSSLVVCAIAIAFAAMAASPAEANFRVVKWPTGMCQVWNYGAGNKPTGARAVSKSYKTMARAMRAQARAQARKRCS